MSFNLINDSNRDPGWKLNIKANLNNYTPNISPETGQTSIESFHSDSPIPSNDCAKDFSIVHEILSKSLFYDLDFIQLVNFYNRYHEELDCRFIIEKCIEQINQQPTIKKILHANVICQELKINKSFILKHSDNEQILTYPFYFEQILRISFKFFEEAISSSSKAELLSSQESNQLKQIKLSPPKTIQSDDFFLSIEKYFHWLFNDQGLFSEQYILLQNYFEATPAIPDINSYLIDLIHNNQIENERLESILGHSLFLSRKVNETLAAYLLKKISIEQSEATEPMINFFNNIFGSFTLDLSFYSPEEITSLSNYLANSAKKNYPSFFNNFFNTIYELKFPEKLNTKDLLKILQAFPKINSLDLSGIDLIDDEIVHLITIFSSNLTKIKLSGCQISDKSLDELALKYPNLSSIDLSYCRLITTVGIKKIKEKCLFLNTLDLRGCQLDPDCLNLLSETWDSLTVIKLPEIPEGVIHKFIDKLAYQCPRLVEIDFYINHHFNDSAIQALAKRCPHLSIVNFDAKTRVEEPFKNFFTIYSGFTSLLGKNNISLQALKILIQSCKKLSVIRIGVINVLPPLKNHIFP